MDRIILRHSDFRQAHLRTLSTASATRHTDLTYRDTLIFVRAESVRTTQLLTLQASFGSHLQTDLRANTTDNAFHLISFQGSHFQIRISDIGLTNDRAITAARATMTAAHLSTVRQDNGDAALDAIMLVGAQAINAHSIASRRYCRQFDLSNCRSRSVDGFDRSELSTCKTRFSVRQTNFSTDINGATAAQVTASAAVYLKRRFPCLNGPQVFVRNGFLKDRVGGDNRRRHCHSR